MFTSELSKSSRSKISILELTYCKCTDYQEVVGTNIEWEDLNCKTQERLKIIQFHLFLHFKIPSVYRNSDRSVGVSDTSSLPFQGLHSPLYPVTIVFASRYHWASTENSPGFDRKTTSAQSTISSIREVRRAWRSHTQTVLHSNKDDWRVKRECILWLWVRKLKAQKYTCFPLLSLRRSSRFSYGKTMHLKLYSQVLLTSQNINKLSIYFHYFHTTTPKLHAQTHLNSLLHTHFLNPNH